MISLLSCLRARAVDDIRTLIRKLEAIAWVEQGVLSVDNNNRINGIMIRWSAPIRAKLGELHECLNGYEFYSCGPGTNEEKENGRQIYNRRLAPVLAELEGALTASDERQLDSFLTNEEFKIFWFLAQHCGPDGVSSAWHLA